MTAQSWCCLAGRDCKCNTLGCKKIQFQCIRFEKNKVCLRIAEICKLNFFTEIGNQNLQINFELNYSHFFLFCSRELEVDKPIID